MDRRDETLTCENVDEQIEQELTRLQEQLPVNETPLAQLVRNLREIYEEKFRLEQAWERINSRAAGLDLAGLLTQDGQLETFPLQGPQRIASAASARRPQRLRHWRNMGAGLAAAVLLLAIATYAVWASALHNPPSAGPRPAVTAVSPGVKMQEYSGQYFKIQYPTGWIITRTAAQASSSSLLTVQFRPAATSPIEVNVDAMAATSLSSDQLLRLDVDTKLGRLISTQTVNFHGIIWTVGIIELGENAQGQAGKLEIAYSNKAHPYRIELGTTPSMFETYAPVFHSMFASFYPQTRTATPVATTPSATATLPPTATVPHVKTYSDHYFTIAYLASWVVTGVESSNTYVETVQFRPRATSSISIDVDVLHSSHLSAQLLLLTDPDVGLGTLLNTSTLTYHGLSWTVGSMNLTAAGASQESRVEVAYTNEQTPYRVKFSAPLDQAPSYSAAFTAVLTSFYPVG
ncbi:MAG TPA: hypothetical protein VGF67_15940 [Ktedonobacteraceae bacterium]|jgi:hypothetical protein